MKCWIKDRYYEVQYFGNLRCHCAGDYGCNFCNYKLSDDTICICDSQCHTMGVPKWKTLETFKIDHQLTSEEIHKIERYVKIDSPVQDMTWALHALIVICYFSLFLFSGCFYVEAKPGPLFGVFALCTCFSFICWAITAAIIDLLTGC